MRRGACFLAGNSDEFRAVVLHRSDLLPLLWLPPLIGNDAVSVGVCSGEKRGMSGRSPRIGIVVITIREVGAAIKKKPEPALAKLVAIALQVVSAKLVDDNHDHELGMTVVG